MLLRFPISLSLAFAATAIASPLDQQHPIFENEHESFNGQQIDLIKELEKAHIIPSVLDPFTPLITLNATWKKATAEVGNTIKPKKAKIEPVVHFLDTVPFSLSFTGNDELHKLSPGIQLTVALTDPDAPSHTNPKWSQICHWIATDVQLSSSSITRINDDEDENENKHPHHRTLTEIMPYKAPGPPPKTGKHRYIFVALAPTNGTTEKLNLSKPKDRQRWGFESEGEGLREWAGMNGLSVVGANFVYAQHKKQ